MLFIVPACVSVLAPPVSSLCDPGQVTDPLCAMVRSLGNWVSNASVNLKCLDIGPAPNTESGTFYVNKIAFFPHPATLRILGRANAKGVAFGPRGKGAFVSHR